jgi:hypothetical protein
MSLGLGALLLVTPACTYDFDHFASSSDSGVTGGQGGSGTGGVPASGGSSGGSVSSSGASGAGAGAGGGTAAGGTAGATGGTAGTGGTGSVCDAGATEWMGHCYFTLPALSWTAARIACAAINGSHLVTIGSVEEQTMVEQTFFPSTLDIWIGLSLADPTQAPPASCTADPPSCPYVWVTTEALQYTDWRTAAEPNFSGSCVRIQAASLQWADYTCATQLPAICEQE